MNVIGLRGKYIYFFKAIVLALKRDFSMFFFPPGMWQVF